MSGPPLDMYCSCGELLTISPYDIEVAKSKSVASIKCKDKKYGCNRAFICAGHHHTNSISSWQFTEAIKENGCPFCKKPHFWKWVKNEKIEWNKIDKIYWRSIFQRCEAENFILRNDSQYGRLSYIKQSRYEHRLPKQQRGYDPIADYPIEGEWIDKILSYYAEEYEGQCFSNTRFCAMDKAGDRKRYKKAKSRGCCGYHDEEVKHPVTQRVFRIGFNYGH